MSQRKAKEYRRAMEQYMGVAADVDDLKRRIGAVEARHRREDREKVAEMNLRQQAAKARADLEWAKAMEKVSADRSAERRRRNERRRRIARRRRITAMACMAILALILVCAFVTACAARDGGQTEGPESTAASEDAPPAIPPQKRGISCRQREKRTTPPIRS